MAKKCPNCGKTYSGTMCYNCGYKEESSETSAAGAFFANFSVDQSANTVATVEKKSAAKKKRQKAGQDAIQRWFDTQDHPDPYKDGEDESEHPKEPERKGSSDAAKPDKTGQNTGAKQSAGNNARKTEGHSPAEKPVAEKSAPKEERPASESRDTHITGGGQAVPEKKADKGPEPEGNSMPVPPATKQDDVQKTAPNAGTQYVPEKRGKAEAETKTAEAASPSIAPPARTTSGATRRRRTSGGNIDISELKQALVSAQSVETVAPQSSSSSAIHAVPSKKPAAEKHPAVKNESTQTKKNKDSLPRAADTPVLPIPEPTEPPEPPKPSEQELLKAFVAKGTSQTEKQEAMAASKPAVPDENDPVQDPDISEKPDKQEDRADYTQTPTPKVLDEDSTRKERPFRFFGGNTEEILRRAQMQAQEEIRNEENSHTSESNEPDGMATTAAVSDEEMSEEDKIFESMFLPSQDDEETAEQQKKSKRRFFGKKRGSLPLSRSADDEDFGNEDVASYEPNKDGYYNDVVPEFDAPKDKLKKKDVIKFLAFIGVMFLVIVYFIFSL